MAVSGRRHERPFKDTIGTSSAEDGEVFCQPCSRDGDWIVAVGYCTNCNEYLCAICLKVHRKQAMSRNHKILEGENMPKVQMSSGTIAACSELCHKHTNEIMKFYCSAHDVVGCGDCMVLDHKTCKVDRIQDISTSYFNGTEHQDLLRKLDQFLKNIEQVNKEIKINGKTMQQTYFQAEHDIKAFKKEVIDYLDKAEANMLAELNKRKQIDEKLMSSLKENEKSMRDTIQELHEKLQIQINQANDLFVAAKEVKANITRIGDTVNQLQLDCHFSQYEFVCSKQINGMLASQYKLGELLVKKKITGKMTGDVATVEKRDFAKMEPQFNCDIGIKASDDSGDCMINACALISSKLMALADACNNCVKIVDIEKRNISARYKLQSYPKGVAVVTPSCIAVTIPDEQKILYLTISQNGKLSISHDIAVKGKCTKIGCKDDKLIIVFNDHVEIRNINGKMIKSISHPSLKRLMDIAVAHDSKAFYISKSPLFEVASVLKYDLDGNLIATYSDKDLPNISGFSVTGDGSVLVCNWEKNGSIHIISPECKKIREILKESKHARYPLCVAFCDDTNKLFLCNQEFSLDSELKNVLKVFQLK